MAHFICKKCSTAVYYSLADPAHYLTRAEEAHALDCLARICPGCVALDEGRPPLRPPHHFGAGCSLRDRKRLVWRVDETCCRCKGAGFRTHETWGDGYLRVVCECVELDEGDSQK